MSNFIPSMPGDVEAQLQAEKLILDWDNLRYDVKGKSIVSGVSGRVESGELLAVMGPSGAGKSTILDLISMRTLPSDGKILLNGEPVRDMRRLASYVEQSDALLGVLSVEETIRFAARLSLDPATPKRVIRERVSTTISDLGLADVSDNRIGNAVQRGISGGQKRRVTIASSLVTMPKILLLDEPTSGLDSRTSYEVILAIKNMAQRHGMIVIASIHQPNWDTFALFDKLLLLANGKTVYFGPTDRLDNFLAEGLSHPVPTHANPADHALNIINTDFMSDTTLRTNFINEIAETWTAYSREYPTFHCTTHMRASDSWEKEDSEKNINKVRKPFELPCAAAARSSKTTASQTWILMERNMLNYSRNLLAYGVRLGMYLGMGVLLATVWVNLAQTSTRINDRLSVHFFSVAFLGFMSVAGIPAFLEERQVFVRERMNGLYGPGAYVLANTLCTLPYLFACALLFSVLCYWSIGLNPGADQFFRFLGILFLAVYAAESQSAVIAAIIPIFVAALAVASFLNGFWMCVGGYFIRAVNLPRFWYYWAHFIDYQTYAFDLLVHNDLHGLVFGCEETSGSCVCSYPSSLISEGRCAISGDDVLNALGINGISFSLYACILLIITIFYRFLLYLVLVVKKR